MKVFMNEKNEIKAVGSTADTSLREVEILDKGNPFANWSEDRICCFKADIRNGIVYGFTLYVKSTVVDKIILAEKISALQADNDALRAENEMLASCILEMSEVLYA